MAQADLEYILNELRQKGSQAVIPENPRYVVDEFQEFHGDTARVFQAYASVYFFYLDGVRLCQNRKYRYRTTARVWERFEVRLVHIPQKYLGVVEN